MQFEQISAADIDGEVVMWISGIVGCRYAYHFIHAMPKNEPCYAVLCIELMGMRFAREFFFTNRMENVVNKWMCEWNRLLIKVIASLWIFFLFHSLPSFVRFALDSTFPNVGGRDLMRFECVQLMDHLPLIIMRSHRTMCADCTPSHQTPNER